MRIELKTLQTQLGLTSVYVTHDQSEAMVLADHLVVMRDGVIEQEGGAEEVYLRPRTRFVASFLGVANIVSGRVSRLDRDVGCLEVPGLGVLSAYLQDDVRGRLAIGEAACISIRPMAMRLSASPPDAELPNRFEARVVQKVFLGELIEYAIQIGDLGWRVHTHASHQFNPGDSAWASFMPASATMVIDR